MTPIRRRLTGFLFLITVVVGIMALVFSPADAPSKTALGLSVIALILAAVTYATSPDWEAVSADIHSIRESMETSRPIETRRSVEGSRKTHRISALELAALLTVASLTVSILRNRQDQ